MKWAPGLRTGFVGLGVSKIRSHIYGVPIPRTAAYWDPYWDPPIVGNYHLRGEGFHGF